MSKTNERLDLSKEKRGSYDFIMHESCQTVARTPSGYKCPSVGKEECLEKNITNSKNGNTSCGNPPIDPIVAQPPSKNYECPSNSKQPKPELPISQPPKPQQPKEDIVCDPQPPKPEPSIENNQCPCEPQVPVDPPTCQQPKPSQPKENDKCPSVPQPSKPMPPTCEQPKPPQPKEDDECPSVPKPPKPETLEPHQPKEDGECPNDPQPLKPEQPVEDIECPSYPQPPKNDCTCDVHEPSTPQPQKPESPIHDEEDDNQQHVVLDIKPITKCSPKTKNYKTTPEAMPEPVEPRATDRRVPRSSPEAYPNCGIDMKPPTVLEQSQPTCNCAKETLTGSCDNADKVASSEKEKVAEKDSTGIFDGIVDLAKNVYEEIRDDVIEVFDDITGNDDEKEDKSSVSDITKDNIRTLDHAIKDEPKKEEKIKQTEILKGSVTGGRGLLEYVQYAYKEIADDVKMIIEDVKYDVGLEGDDSKEKKKNDVTDGSNKGNNKGDSAKTPEVKDDIKDQPSSKNCTPSKTPSVGPAKENCTTTKKHV